MDEQKLHPAYTRESKSLRLSGVIGLGDLSSGWALQGATGEGVRVAVIDSGIELDHPAVKGGVDAKSCIDISVDDEGGIIETHGPHNDAFGHGTACAGIIHSLAPRTRITSVRVLGGALTGKASAFLRGIGWAIEEGYDVINLSLGAGKREWALAFHEICDEAYFRGSLIVTAANNVPNPSFPSLFASVTSVACNLSKDPFRFHYNPNPPTEFLARGIDVDVAWKGGGYITASGNSFAAPHISGIAALIRSKHPTLRPFQLKTVLWAIAANVQEAPRMPGRLSGHARPINRSSRASSALGLKAQ